MPVLRREDDGTQFALQPYRELLSLPNSNLLRKELFFLSENYGIYAHISQQLDGRYETVFSHDPGYLLGEIIWQHFGQIENLIYCEALSERDQLLIVVVRDGLVVLDAKLDRTQFVEELTTLIVSNIIFTIYISGDVPLSVDSSAQDKFIFPPELVQTFTVLPNSVFNSLIPNPAYQLLPIEQAVAALNLGRKERLFLLAMLAVIAIGLSAWWYTHKVEEAPPAVTLLAQYQAALQTPAPDQQLQALAEKITLLYNIPGWLATHIEFSGGVAKVQLHSLGGSVANLLAFANTQQLNISITQGGTYLNLSVPAAIRFNQTTPNKTESILAKIVDRMMHIIPTKSVQIVAVNNFGIYKETQLMININHIAPDVLLLISQQLSELPINLVKGTFDLNNGLLSGTILLTVLGN